MFSSTVKGLGVNKGFGFGVHKAEVVFLELFYFSCVLMDVGNLISGSSAISKSTLNNWKLLVHELLKSYLEIFEHYFDSVT